MMRARSVLLLLLLLGVVAAPAAAAEQRVLRVCADPNNLPFSNERGEGFENRLAALIAAELGARLEYTWWAQRRGFLHRTLEAGLCDLVPGIATGVEDVATTRPYYRSTYVFVTRRDRGLAPSTFDDPQLRGLRIGVQMIGDDATNTPPAHALARRGITEGVVGYSVLGDYAQPNPPARIIEAVAAGEVDVAIAWGPLAGYFAQRSPVPLQLTPVAPAEDPPGLRFAFDIAMAVREDDAALRDEVDALLVRKQPEIDAILQEFGVPRVDVPAAGAHS